MQPGPSSVFHFPVLSGATPLASQGPAHDSHTLGEAPWWLLTVIPEVQVSAFSASANAATCMAAKVPFYGGAGGGTIFTFCPLRELLFTP